MQWQVVAGSFIAGPVCLLGLIYMILKHRPRVSVKDKVVLITGATSGLGKACARVFYLAGCRVILAGRSLEKLADVKEELKIIAKSQHEPKIVKIDLEDVESPVSAAEEAFKFYNQIDILINNAGISYRGTIQDTSIDVDRKVMQVNYFGQVALTKAILPRMLQSKNGGHIVGISSVQGKISIPYRSAYSASKHAFQAFCDCLRAECADNNIRVSVISPGYIQTNLSLNAVTSDGSNYGVMDKTTENGMSPEEVANKVLQSIEFEKEEDILCPLAPRIACYLRTIAPVIFFWLMKSRARKGRKENK